MTGNRLDGSTAAIRETSRNSLVAVADGQRTTNPGGHR